VRERDKRERESESETGRERTYQTPGRAWDLKTIREEFLEFISRNLRKTKFLTTSKSLEHELERGHRGEEGEGREMRKCSVWEEREMEEGGRAREGGQEAWEGREGEGGRWVPGGY
jgi:hypothetical protein